MIDGRANVAVDRALVSIKYSTLSNLTDARGRFHFDCVSPGPQIVVVSVVGYDLVTRAVAVTRGGTVEMTIVLQPSGYTESVTVRATTANAPQDISGGRFTVGSAELQQLRGVLVDDPFRAVQALPGVAATDDGRAEFAVRGSDPRHIGIVVDGVPAPILLHTLRGAEDSGSLAMLNSDVLESVTLERGGYPQTVGAQLGAQVDFRLREGSRDRLHGQAAVSGTNAVAIAEGPIGSAKRGSWLVGVRQSYVGWLTRKLDHDTKETFGFTDGQLHVVYDVSTRHRLQITAIGGRFGVQNVKPDPGLNALNEGNNRAGLANIGFRSILPVGVLTQHAYGFFERFANTNPTGLDVSHGGLRTLGYRVDLSVGLTPKGLFDVGGFAERRHEDLTVWRYDPALPALARIDEGYDAEAPASGGYAQITWQFTSALQARAGGRVNRDTLTSRASSSPWAQIEWAPGGWRLRGGVGRFHQAPDFLEADGLHGSTLLAPEAASHYDLSLERAWRGVSAQVGVYDREERGVIWRPDAEVRIEDGDLAFPSVAGAFENGLDGHSRGLELLIQRRSPNGLSGWISYSLSYTKYRDRTTGVSFWGDDDQRQTLNVLVHYRSSERFSLSSKLRLGSNFPVVGYYSPTGESMDDAPTYGITDHRNTARIPAYARVDLRLDRTFHVAQSRLTLFGEVVNVLDRTNFRIDGPGRLEKLLSILPSAGVSIEF